MPKALLFPSDALVEEAVEAVLELLPGKTLNRETVLQVARLVLSVAWCHPHPTTENGNGRDPFARWCRRCAGVVRADYRPHPTLAGVRAMLCPGCGAVTQPIVRNRASRIGWREEARSRNWQGPLYS